MEFVFLLISIVFAGGLLIFIPYTVYEDWGRTKRSLMRQFTEDDGILGILYVMIGLLFAMMIFIFLCACNNTWWHLAYLTTKGLWER